MHASPDFFFDHEKLIAYPRSIQFVAWASPLLEDLPSRLAVSDQLDRASTSVPLNIAEGNGKYTAPDRCRYFENARGSALECAACLDVLVAKGKCTAEQIQSGKAILHETVCLVVGLIRRPLARSSGGRAHVLREPSRNANNGPRTGVRVSAGVRV